MYCIVLRCPALCCAVLCIVLTVMYCTVFLRTYYNEVTILSNEQALFCQDCCLFFLLLVLSQNFHTKGFCICRNICEEGKETVLLNGQVGRFLCAVVDKISGRVTDKHWDFIMCTLVSWIQVTCFFLCYN